ncbi:ORF1241 [White spot syndrome virus]|uniref:ORF1241 n=1 Tax=White spot syndrome virus TaxID=342409 RepID=A0A2D3I772_9VIRU|nr:ORF1241 [White spot syndrome virus]
MKYQPEELILYRNGHQEIVHFAHNFLLVAFFLPRDRIEHSQPKRVRSESCPLIWRLPLSS